MGFTRRQCAGPAQVAALAAQSLNSDSAYIATAKLGSLEFRHGNAEVASKTRSRSSLLATAKDYEDGIAATTGHFSADLGFEYFFTGHAGLLAPGAASNPFDSSDHPLEHTFRQWMAVPANLKEYHAKTRENIQQLFSWVEGVQRALPVERSELWSEGEENFEARLDAILARR